MKFINLLVLFTLLSSCSFLNPIIGYERAFRLHLNSVVGEKFENIRNMQGGWFVVDKKIEINEEFSIYYFSHTYIEYEFKCEWTMAINKKTGVVQAWEYISPPKYCRRNYFLSLAP